MPRAHTFRLPSGEESAVVAKYGPNAEPGTIPASTRLGPSVHEHIQRSLGAYRAPSGDQGVRYAAITARTLEYAEFLADVCPPSGELMLAIRALEECRMRANQSIATNEVPAG